jgi:hypothetical protein
MTVDFASFARASTLIHSLQGGAFLLLGAAELYTFKYPGRRAEIIGPLAMLLAGALGLMTVIALPGGWSFGTLAAALAERSGFHLFIALSWLFAAAGLSRLMQQLSGRAGGPWQVFFLVFLTAIAAVYLLLAWRVNPEAWRAVLVPHAGIAAALLLAALAKLVYAFFGGRALQLSWAFFILITAIQLLAYREAASTFGMRTETVQSGPGLTPEQEQEVLRILNIKNAGATSKKRSGN